MATDPKLTQSIIDLSRNVDKLSSELKKNTTAVETSAATHVEAIKATEKAETKTETPRGIDISGEISNLTKSLRGLDFKGLSKNIFDFKKGILGGFESGGIVKNPGNYVVGEKGPEVVKLKTGDTVIPNKKSSGDELIKLQIEQLKRANKKAPTDDELSRERARLMADDPDLTPRGLTEKLSNFVDNFNRGTFTKEDVAKLGKPISPAEAIKGPAVPANLPQESPAAKESRRERRERLLAQKKAEAPLPAPTGKELTGEPKEKGGALRQFGQFLGKEIGPLSKLGAETFGIGSSIKDLTGLGLAGKGFGLPEMGNLFQPTLKSILPKISAGPKLAQTVGSLATDTLGKGKGLGLIEGVINKLGTKIEQAVQTKTEKPAPMSEAPPPATTAMARVERKGEGEIQGMTKTDIEQMLGTLARIAALLEGPLSVSPLDYPFRPDSRRV